MPDDDQVNVNDPEDFRNLIESEALGVIVNLLEKGEIDGPKARHLSSMFLDMITPGMTVSELYEGTVKLDDANPELSPVVYKIMKIYEEKFEKKALSTVSELVKNKQYNQAQDMVKKVLQYKINS
jgi:hypothetical protein